MKRFGVVSQPRFCSVVAIGSILIGMRALFRATVLACSVVLFGPAFNGHSQGAPTPFEVASVRPSQREVGPDYNNQIAYTPGEFAAHNVTLKRLVAEAWRCQIKQVVGPPWIDRNEYEVSARLPEGATREQVPAMLGALLLDRFALKTHQETRPMRVYELTVGRSGPKIHASSTLTAGSPESAPRKGFHFHGSMREFADFLAVQFSIPAAENPNTPAKAGGPSIPVLDKTGLDGAYDFGVDVRPELGTDAFTTWKRALADQLGLEIESSTADVPMVIVDDAAKIPTEN